MLWKEFEIYVENYFRSKFWNSRIERNLKIKGSLSKRTRQIDLTATGIFNGKQEKVIVECKYYNKRIDIKIVESFLGLLDDIQYERGVIVSNNGFTKSAVERINYSNKKVELWELDLEPLAKISDLNVFAIIRGHRIIFTRPKNWMPEVDRTSEVLFLHPLGLNMEFSNKNFEVISVDIKSKLNYNHNSLSILENIRNEYLKRNLNYKEIVISNSLLPRNLENGESVLIKFCLENVKDDFYYILDYSNRFYFIRLMTPIEKSNRYMEDLVNFIKSIEII